LEGRSGLNIGRRRRKDWKEGAALNWEERFQERKSDLKMEGAIYKGKNNLEREGAAQSETMVNNHPPRHADANHRE
jgi:hypothetical protein